MQDVPQALGHDTHRLQKDGIGARLAGASIHPLVDDHTSGHAFLTDEIVRTKRERLGPDQLLIVREKRRRDGQHVPGLGTWLRSQEGALHIKATLARESQQAALGRPGLLDGP